MYSTFIEEVLSLKLSTQLVLSVNVRLLPVYPPCSYSVTLKPGLYPAYDIDGILGSATNRIQDLIQPLDQIDELPPYDSILEDLTSIIAIIP